MCADFLEKIQQSSSVGDELLAQMVAWLNAEYLDLHRSYSEDELLAQMVAWLNDLEDAGFTVAPFDQKKDKQND